MEVEEFPLGENIIIDDTNLLKENVMFVIQKEIDLKEVKNFVESEENTIFYFDERMSLQSKDSMRKVKYVWIDSGYRTRDNQTLFISMVYYPDYNIIKGHFIGTAKYLGKKISIYSKGLKNTILSNISDRFLPKYMQKADRRKIQYLYKATDYSEPKEKGFLIDQSLFSNIEIKNNEEMSNNDEFKQPNIEREPENLNDQSYMLTKSVKEIYDNLLYSNLRTMTGLERYLKDLGTIVNNYIRENKTDYYVINNQKKLIINKGLMDKYGTDILVLYRYHIKYDHYCPYSIIHSKQDFLMEGFKKEDSSKKLKPLKLLQDEKFQSNIDDFDISHHSLVHIIEQRYTRFPEALRDLPQSIIVSKLIGAIERGLKMQERDCTFVKPLYSNTRNAIAWVMPFHVEADLSSDPELVLVIDKSKDFYEIKTILPYNDEIKDRLTELSLYRNLW